MSINQDQVKGHAQTAIGTVKEAAGKIIGNKELEVKGNVQKNVGHVQTSIGEAKSSIDKALKSV